MAGAMGKQARRSISRRRWRKRTDVTGSRSKLRAALYTRVSTDEQSSSLQLDETTAFCEHRGWPIVARFDDDGVSSTSKRRPGLDAMLAAARRRHFDVLVVWKFDRVYRGITSSVIMLNELRELGVHFVSATQPIDTSTTMGRGFYSVMAWFAEMELDMIRERTKAGMAAARRRGARIGRPPRLTDADLAAIEHMRLLGYTWSQIAKDLGVSERALYRLSANAGSRAH